MHDTAQHRRTGRVAGPPQGRASLGRRTAVDQRRSRLERRLVHSQGEENALARKAVERHRADPLDDISQKEEVDVAVENAVIWGKQRHFLYGAGDCRGVPFPLVTQIEVWSESGRMREQLPDGDVLLAVPCKLGNIGCHTVREPDLSLL